MNPSTLSNESLLHSLRWRYATKRFDATRKIDPSVWATLEEALVLSPSSFGLQPWRFWVVRNTALRERLVPASWDQRQVADASHLVVFSIQRDVGEEAVNHYLHRMAQVRQIPVESLAGFKKVLLDFLGQPKESFDVNAWSARQAYIALGNFLTSAALLGVDTCPLEGIDPAQYDEILGLKAKGYRTVVAVAAGYRAADDKYSVAPKVRFAKEEVVQQLA